MTRLSGFTLIEVLIALVILALGFTACYLSLSSVAQHFLYMQNKTAASWVAGNVIARAQLGLVDSGATGNESQLGRNWQWHVDISNSPDPSVLMIHASVADAKTRLPMITMEGYMSRNLSL